MASRTAAEPRLNGSMASPRPGLKTLRRAVHRLGSRVIDRRTKVGRALAAWRAELIADLGGASVLSVQAGAIVDLVVTERLVLSSLDAWLIGQAAATGVVNRRSKTLMPVLKERTALADSMARHLQALGLDRKAPPERTLAEIVADIEAGKAAKARVAPVSATAGTKQALGSSGHGEPSTPLVRPTAPQRGPDAPVEPGAPEPVVVSPLSLRPEDPAYPSAPAEVRLEF